MKRLSMISIIIFLVITISAQTPQAFKYQAVVRNSLGEIIANQEISVQISILDGSPTGPAVYIESHDPVTNQFGLINIEVGNGDVVAGAFSNIFWGDIEYFLQVEIDETGGTNYLLMGASQILSVPRALYAETAEYAETAGYAEDNDWFFDEGNMYTNLTGSVGIGSDVKGTDVFTAKLQVVGDYPSTGGIEDILTLWRGSTQPITSGMGAGLTFNNEVANGAYARTARIASLTSDPTTPTGSLLFQTRPVSGNLNYAMIIDGDGKVGIGDFYPTSMLEISVGEGISDAFMLSSTENYNGGLFIVKNSGNVGIGNKNPLYKLDVSGNRIQLKEESTDDWIALRTDHSANLLEFDGADLWIESPTNGNNIIFNPFTDGNVAIGTTVTTSKLTVDGNISGSGYSLTGGSGYQWNIGNYLGGHFAISQVNSGLAILIKHASGNVGINTDDPTEKLEVNGNIKLTYGNKWIGLSGTQGLYIQNDGNIGIGTTSPTRKLHLVGANPRIYIEASSSNPEINLSNAGDPSTSIWSIYKDGATDDLRFYQNGNRISIQSSTGNVSIGTTNPAGYRLNVAGTAYCSGGWQASDIRFKEDIRNIISPLEKVMRMHGVSYSWKKEEHEYMGFPEGRHYGVIAQEIEQVLPEIVRTGPEGDKAVAYSELIPVIIEAMKELKSENEILKARIEKLEKNNNQ
ncbi:MAG: tail fiber domain-containing protein [Bacteroidetes bacterium]|nr:tail fiber domain-containing protein [Bacteroidota bacterium]MBL7102943.1 tail fiber domain-containing protein [Bacteroidales bacterium]